MLNPNFNGAAITPVNNNNQSLLNDPQINAAMDKAALISDDAQRSKAWGAIDKQLIEKAVAIPWFWDKVANITSKDVDGVVAQWNASWDLAYTSLK
jgi:peptide/nickel transport system substrate-binding protein